MREPDAPEQRASPRGETFPLHQVPAKRRPGSERYGERADRQGASGDAHGELCSPPLHSRRGKSMDEAEKGRTQARSMWSERRYRQRGELSFPHMRDSRRVALCGVSHSRQVGSEATRQRGELSSPICGTAAARICRDGAFRLVEGRIRGDQAASDTEEAAAQAIPFAPATAADDVERAEISPDD